MVALNARFEQCYGRTAFRLFGERPDRTRVLLRERVTLDELPAVRNDLVDPSLFSRIILELNPMPLKA